MIAVACVVLCWLGPQLTQFKLARTLIDWLPIIGSGAFAAEAIVKLIK